MKTYIMTKKTSKQITDRLSLLTADLALLLIKTLGFHWNMEDPRFLFLHELLDKQYHQLLEDVDLIAERIRQLGVEVKATMKQFLHDTRLKEANDLKAADAILKNLINSYEQLFIEFKYDIALCESLGDPVTTDILIEILRQYEKHVWVLKSHL